MKDNKRLRTIIKYTIIILLFVGTIALAFLLGLYKEVNYMSEQQRMLWTSGIFMGTFGMISLYVAYKDKFWESMWLPKKKDKNKTDD